jgi:2-keto-4-pentenoate hydratase/2-oxohepta-3-ene-1,7-dioic acid hydratase in catechol pathway
MRFCRFVDRDGIRYGLVEKVNGEDAITARLRGPWSQVNEWGVPESILLPDFSKPERLDSPIPLDAAMLLVPLPNISKIVCVGRNYLDHVKEFNRELPPEPILFLKPPTSLLPPGGKIIKPNLTQRLDHEAELGIVIGRTCHKLLPDEDIRPYILGYTCVNDVTARDLQQKDGQWTRGKGFDTFCPVGPVITTDLDPSHLQVQARVNGQIRQDANTRDLIFGLDVIMHHAAEAMTLLPGDIVATGTPSGVGPMNAGDTVEVTVEGIGTLRNVIVAES